MNLTSVRLDRSPPQFSASRPASFERQFLIFDPEKARPRGIPQTFRRHAGSRLVCAACPTLPVTELHDRIGRPIGFVLGDPVDLDGARYMRQAIRLDARSPEDVDAAFDRLYERLGGAFLIVLDGFGLQHIYLDAGGQMSLVFDPQTRIAAATTGLLLDDRSYAERFDRKLYSHLGIIRRDGWFPAGLTAHAGIVRLLANHRLDLATMQISRHWPRDQVAASDAPHEAVAEACRAARAIIDVARNDGPVVLGLTAGSDTRMLLAICRDIARDLSFATLDQHESSLDVASAKQLAHRFGLEHRTLPLVRANGDEAWEWHALTGHCVGGVNMWTHPSAKPLAGTGALAGGLGGEIGRGFYWRKTDTEGTDIGPETLTSRLGLPPHPRVAQAVAEWHRSVARFGPFQQLDLAYLELRISSWACTQAYVMPQVHYINPLISRRAVTSMMSLPVHWRHSQLMVLSVIEQSWPELLELPINRYGDFRDTLSLVRRAIRQPHLVLKKARQMLA